MIVYAYEFAYELNKLVLFTYVVHQFSTVRLFATTICLAGSLLYCQKNSFDLHKIIQKPVQFNFGWIFKKKFAEISYKFAQHCTFMLKNCTKLYSMPKRMTGCVDTASLQHVIFVLAYCKVNCV